MTRNRLTRSGVVLALVAALVSAPTAAFAQSDEQPTRDTRVTDERPRDERPADRHADGLEAAKRHALAAIARRLATIEQLRGAIGRNRHVTEDHASALQRDLADAASGLAELARKIEAAETAEELRPLVESIVVDFRIYVLVVPKVHEVLASDTLLAVASHFDRFADKLGQIIARAEEAGLEVGEAKRLLGEMRDLIAAAERTAGPVAGSVIGLQPGDWPDPAKGLLRAGKDSLHEAAGNLRAAHRAGVDIVKILRELIGGHDRTDVAHDRATDGARDV